MSHKIQNEDVKSQADLVAQGLTSTQAFNALVRDSKIAVTANGIDKTLFDAIQDGDIGGSGAETVSVQAASFTADNRHIYICTAALTVTLPAPSLGAKVSVKRVDNAAVVVAAGAATIDGVAGNKTLDSVYESVTLVSDGTNWFII